MKNKFARLSNTHISTKFYFICVCGCACVCLGFIFFIIWTSTFFVSRVFARRHSRMSTGLLFWLTGGELNKNHFGDMDMVMAVAVVVEAACIGKTWGGHAVGFDTFRRRRWWSWQLGSFKNLRSASDSACKTKCVLNMLSALPISRAREEKLKMSSVQYVSLNCGLQRFKPFALLIPQFYVLFMLVPQVMNQNFGCITELSEKTFRTSGLNRIAERSLHHLSAQPNLGRST